LSTHRDQAETELDPDVARLRQRLRELRSRHPGVVLATELTHIHDDQVVVRATVTVPNGPSASAHAAEPTDSSGLLDGAIELAELRATTRALDLLSIGDSAAGATHRATPVSRVTADVTDDRVIEEGATPPVIDALRKASPRREAGAERPRVRAADMAASRPSPRNNEESNRAASEPDDEPDLADYTWTHFWTWARANDLSTKGQVEQRIGRVIDSLTPRDVRKMLHEKGTPL
jgi:hypothetical protein